MKFSEIIETGITPCCKKEFGSVPSMTVIKRLSPTKQHCQCICGVTFSIDYEIESMIIIGGQIHES